MNWSLITQADLTEVARARKLGKVIGTAFRQVKPSAPETIGANRSAQPLLWRPIAHLQIAALKKSLNALKALSCAESAN